jgi:hypothetical protein
MALPASSIASLSNTLGLGNGTGGQASAPPASAYSQTPDGNGGFNYALNGQPITVQQYNTGTGLNVSPTATSPLAQPAQPQGSVLGDSTTASTDSAIDPAAAGMYQQAATQDQNQINQNPQDLLTTLGNLSSAYNTALTAQNQNDQNATDQYNLTQNQNATNEQTAQDNIATNTRQETNALQRLLGAAGAGNSSASEIAAPYYVNQQGATANNANQTAFGQGQQNLDLSYNTAKQQEQNAATTLGQQYYANQQNAKGQNDSALATLLGQLFKDTSGMYDANGASTAATAAALQPITNQIDQTQNQAQNYLSQYAAPVAYTAPTAYTAPSATSFVQGLQPGATTVAPPSNAAANVTTAPVPVPVQQKQPLVGATS